MMSRQDHGAREPRISLRELLTLLRLLAGTRGFSEVAWQGGGFRYTLFIVRDPAPVQLTLDSDPDTLRGAELRARVREALTPQP